MECVQQALKNTSDETVAKHSAAQLTLSDDFWSNAQTVDDFFVDNLLDFSEAPVLDEEQHNDENIQQDKTVLSQHEPEVKVEGSTASLVPGSDLCFPADDVADLEWLSHFVDDSAAGYSLTVPAGALPAKPDVKYAEPEKTSSPNTIFSAVQTKARSKRTRTGVRVWSLGSNSLTDSSSSSSSSSSLTTSFPSPSNPWAFYSELAQSAESVFGKPPAKKKQATEAQQRRCSHCHVQKTPQWRTGPLGAKTLCNACGVRFKSGRLLPEYRPACSPTFSSEIHSNNHRKVMEMRRKKEDEDGFAVPV